MLALSLKYIENLITAQHIQCYPPDLSTSFLTWVTATTSYLVPELLPLVSLQSTLKTAAAVVLSKV